MKPNNERNKELVLKRVSDPKKWSYGELGLFYKIHKTTVEGIFLRDVKKYATPKQITNYIKIMGNLPRR